MTTTLKMYQFLQKLFSKKLYIAIPITKLKRDRKIPVKVLVKLFACLEIFNVFFFCQGQCFILWAFSSKSFSVKQFGSR